MSLDETLVPSCNTTVRACGGRILGVATPVPEAGASTAIVETRASGVARPIAIAVNARYPTCVSTGAPTAVTGDQKLPFNTVIMGSLLPIIDWGNLEMKQRCYITPKLDITCYITVHAV